MFSDWSKKPDPLRKQIEELNREQEAVHERMAEVEEELRSQNQLPPELESRPAVWRGEDDDDRERAPDNAFWTRRALAAQRARDRNLFIVLFLLLAIVLVWLSRF